MQILSLSRVLSRHRGIAGGGIKSSVESSNQAMCVLLFVRYFVPCTKPYRILHNKYLNKKLLAGGFNNAMSVLPSTFYLSTKHTHVKDFPLS
jgi:hypothetical protein